MIWRCFLKMLTDDKTSDLKEKKYQRWLQISYCWYNLFILEALRENLSHGSPLVSEGNPVHFMVNMTKYLISNTEQSILQRKKLGRERRGKKDYGCIISASFCVTTWTSSLCFNSSLKVSTSIPATGLRLAISQHDFILLYHICKDSTANDCIV